METDDPTKTDFIRNRFGESYLPDVNRRSFVDESSGTVLDRRFGDSFEKDDTLFVVIGSDSGLLHEYLRRVPLGKGSRRLVIEADELHALVEPRVARAGAEAALCSFGEWPAALQACQIDRYAHGGHVELVESLGCVHDHGGRYVPILRRVRADLSAAIHGSQVQVSGRIFMQMQLRNACDNRLPASLLRGIGESCTAMVLGGGPSLDDAIDWVIDHRESLFLIVASRLCGRLQGLGIRPDVVVSVDPKSAMYDLGKEGVLWREVPLVSSYHLAPELLQQWCGPHLYLGEWLPWDRPAGDDTGNFPCMGPTVSHTGAWLAHCCGFERILMSGVDMCYAVGGGSHASGSIERMIGALPSQCDASVITYDGRTAGTVRVLEHGVENMEFLGRHINAEGIRLFNTSPGAARIESVPLIDLAAVELSGIRPTIRLGEDLPSAAEHLAHLRRERADAVRHFRAIRRRCDEAARLLDAMDAARDDAAFKAPRRRLERLEKNLGKEHGPWFDTIKRYASAELLASVRPSGFGDEEHERQEWGRNYYRVVKRTAQTFITFLDDVDRRAEMRLAELDDEPDLDALFAYWDADRTPGRVLRLRERLDSRASPGTVDRLDERAEAFLSTLESGDTAHETSVRAHVMDPANILRNIAFLFRESIAADLASLGISLKGLAPPHDVFGNYATGLCAELAGVEEEALEEYRLVLDRFGEWVEEGTGMPAGFDTLLEETLRHVTRCYLQTGDGESAAGSLALLGELSPRYVPRHARLRQLLGDRAAALDLLEGHVTRFPEDWRALLQMADIYTEAEVPDAADMARRMATEARERDRQHRTPAGAVAENDSRAA